MLATRWVGIEPINGRFLVLSTASLSTLGYENSLSQPAIRLWNDTQHVLPNGQASIINQARTDPFTADEVTR